MTVDKRAKVDPAKWKCSAGHTDTRPRTALICDIGGVVLNSMRSESPALLSTSRSRNERLVPAAARHDSAPSYCSYKKRPPLLVTLFTYIHFNAPLSEVISF